MQKILITGGAGFVGRHFCRHFLDQGEHVDCVDSIVPLTGGIDPEEGWPFFDPRQYKSFRYYRQDCRDFFKEHPREHYDYVFHLAAMVGGREIIENQPLVVAEDLSIDAAFWAWARDAKPTKVICFSSSAAYPISFQRQGSHRLLVEDMIDYGDSIGMPDMTYGWAKLTHEYLAKLAWERHGVKSVIYRPFSGYGEDQDMAYPFPSICKRVLEKQGDPVITVWGSGRQMRDFIHISDCIKGVIATMDQFDEADALNLSTGKLTSFLDFAAEAADLAGYKPRVEGASAKPEGVFARGGDTAKQEKAGFKARVTFREGIGRMLKYLEGDL